MKSAGIFLLSLTMAVGLGGCDIRDKIPLTPEDALRAADSMQAPSREILAQGEDGTRYRYSVKSRRPASWIEARRAISREFNSYCPDGQTPDSIVLEPEIDRDANDGHSRAHPAGTEFVETVLCPARPGFEFEFEFPSTLSHTEATDFMYDRLMKTGMKESSRPMVMPVSGSEYTPKFRQIENTIGSWAYALVKSCPQGVVVRDVMLGTNPPAAANAPEYGGESYLGFITECFGARPLEGVLREAIEEQAGSGP